MKKALDLINHVAIPSHETRGRTSASKPTKIDNSRIENNNTDSIFPNLGKRMVGLNEKGLNAYSKHQGAIIARKLNEIPMREYINICIATHPMPKPYAKDKSSRIENFLSSLKKLRTKSPTKSHEEIDNNNNIYNIIIY